MFIHRVQCKGNGIVNTSVFLVSKLQWIHRRRNLTYNVV